MPILGTTVSMERVRTSETDAARDDREGSPTLSSGRATADALQAALARIALLERRELALRAALATAGVDPDAVLARLELAERPAPAEDSFAEAARAPAPPRAAPEPGFPALHTDASRSLATRLADEVIAGPATLRLRAAARLVDVAGAGAAPALLTAAHDAEGAARASLLELVGRCGAADAAAELVTFFADDASEVRAAAIEATARLVSGEPLADVLRMGLEDPDPRVRRRTALCAASARNVDPGTLLVPLLADSDRQVRRVVCTALAGSHDPVAALALVGALLDDEPTVRNAAGTSAEKLFGKQAAGIAQLPAGERARAVARLRSWVAANLVRLAPGGRLQPPAEPEPEAPAAMEVMLDELMATGHPGAGFEDDIPGWTEENDPELRAAFARFASGAWEEPTPLASEAAALLDEAEAVRAQAGLDAAAFVAHDAEVAANDVAEEPADEVVEQQVEAAETIVDEPVPAEAEVIAEVTDEAVFAEASEPAPVEEAIAAEAPVTEEPAHVEAASAEPVEAVADAPAAIADEAHEDAAEAAAENVAEEPVVEPEVAEEEAVQGPAFEAIEEVLRAALRGSTDADLASELGLNEEELAKAIEAHVAAGRLVRRGRKLFLP